ncbi:GerAB/ArcD/ProY family transporter [Marinicrinis lubricantis]|uniref:GerAB/ArcD/ProY family transporter n=1 Tax=Marinicrinis lubricantis TaxID=2086470 RepID=A0ABW1IQ05_9BACL
MTSITRQQLFSMIFLFEMGSAVIVGLGLQAKQDAWISIGIGMLCGISIFTVYLYLFSLFPQLTLLGILRKVLGKYAGTLCSVLYIMYFFYLASRVMRDFTGLLLMTSLQETPPFVISGTMTMILIYCIYLGTAVLGRTSEILFAVFILFWVFSFALLGVSGSMKFSNLLPVLDQGWGPILKASFPLTMTFPFGESIVFLMFLNRLQQKKKLSRICLISLAISGLILMLTIAMDVMALGPERASMEQFPFLSAVSRIQIGDFIQRLDAIAISTLIIGAFFKIVVFFYASYIGIQELIPAFREGKKMLFLLIAMGVSIMGLTLLIANNFIQHLYIGLQLVPLYLHVPFQYVVPCLIAVWAYLVYTKKAAPKAA